MRIWYQSFGDLTTLPRYRASLERHTTLIAESANVITVHGLNAGTYGSGAVPPISFTRYPFLKYLNQLQIVQKALEAERSGYDAFAIGCYHDPGLREARSVVDIPVLSIGEASMLVACSHAKSFGVVTMCREFADYTALLVRDYGLESRLAAIEIMEPVLTEFDMEDPDQVASVITSGFEHAARCLQRAGAEMVIPGDGNLNEALWALSIREAAGIPVMDAVGCLVKLSECYGSLHRLTGLTTSRASYFAKPPIDQLHDVLSQYGLEDSTRDE